LPYQSTMRHPFFVIFAFVCFVFGSHQLAAQSVSELENRLNRSQSKSEKMNLCYQLAEKTLSSSPSKAADYAHRASMLASELGEKRRESESILLSGEALIRKRDYKAAADRLNWAWNTARNYGHRDLAISAAEKLQELARKQNDLREELKWSREIVNYLKENTGRSAPNSDASRRLESQLQAAETDNRRLREELARVTGQTQLLETTYRQTEAELKETQAKTQAEMSKKDQTITQIAQQKLQSDSLVRTKARMLSMLTSEQLADSMLLAQQERELEAQKARAAEAEVAQKSSENFRNVLALLSGFGVVLAGLFYARYRGQRRMAKELTQKNTLIESEQKKSDNLLLNILPPAIATELKTRNKVAARKYDAATVMFLDFTGFTHVAERLSPEQLVEELDYCFSNFDRIIGKYRIEKIKTVGDAYICASGLSDMNASPSDMIKAALEIQDFLLHLKAERQSQGLPHFEARCGIHTGPVVAGVVGAKKFAYDIWGDTVNTAARMEEACDAGRVNVSETTYSQAKYEFDWQERGRIAAKNKGMMDMYYVTAVKSY
jgi:adenylate cyclase